MQFSQYLKDKNITQEQAAKELNVAQGMVSLWATGERLPRPENMAKIVKWSGGEVQPNDFYEVK